MNCCRKPGGIQIENAYEAEDWLVPVGQLQSRALATRALFEDYALGTGRLAVTHAG